MTASASSGSGRKAFASISRASSTWSRLPQFTPMRTGLPYLRAISIIVANCSSRFVPRPTFPGLIRYLARTRAHSGKSASSLWPLKWKSPTSGTLQPSASSRARIAGTAAAACRVDRDPHHLGAGLRELEHLPRGRGDVRGVGVRHRLDHDRRIAADGDLLDPDLARDAAVHLRVHRFTSASGAPRRYG